MAEPRGEAGPPSGAGRPPDPAYLPDPDPAFLLDPDPADPADPAFLLDPDPADPADPASLPDPGTTPLPDTGPGGWRDPTMLPDRSDPAHRAAPADPAAPANPAEVLDPAGAAESAADLAGPPWSALAAELCSLGHSLVAAGLVLGSGGNLSARAAGGDAALVTARGTWLDRLTPADLSLVRVADGVVLGGAPTPSTEVALHLECYRVRPDVTVVVHVHPQLSVLLTALGHPIRLITTDHVAYVREVRVAPYRHPGTPELGTEAAALLADGCDCVVLSHHGCSVVADSVEMALRRVLNLEEAARLTYAALLLGDTTGEGPPRYRERLQGLADGEH